MNLYFPSPAYSRQYLPHCRFFISPSFFCFQRVRFLLVEYVFMCSIRVEELLKRFRLLCWFAGRFVGELVRICAPGGRILVVTWCHRDLEEGETELKPKEQKLLDRYPPFSCCCCFHGHEESVVDVCWGCVMPTPTQHSRGSLSTTSQLTRCLTPDRDSLYLGLATGVCCALHHTSWTLQPYRSTMRNILFLHDGVAIMSYSSMSTHNDMLQYIIFHCRGTVATCDLVMRRCLGVSYFTTFFVNLVMVFSRSPMNTNRINKAYYLPKWCSLSDYEALFKAEGLEDIRRADWTDNVQVHER